MGPEDPREDLVLFPIVNYTIIPTTAYRGAAPTPLNSLSEAGLSPPLWKVHILCGLRGEIHSRTVRDTNLARNELRAGSRLRTS